MTDHRRCSVLGWSAPSLCLCVCLSLSFCLYVSLSVCLSLSLSCLYQVCKMKLMVWTVTENALLSSFTVSLPRPLQQIACLKTDASESLIWNWIGRSTPLSLLLLVPLLPLYLLLLPTEPHFVIPLFCSSYPLSLLFSLLLLLSLLLWLLFYSPEIVMIPQVSDINKQFLLSSDHPSQDSE